MGAGRRAVVLSGLLWAALPAAPATAADLSSLGIETTPPPAPVIAPAPSTYIDIVDEVRVGVFAHNWIHDESAPVDASVELLSSALPLPGPSDNPWFGWFFRPAHQYRRDDQHRRQDELRLYRPHLAHSDL